MSTPMMLVLVTIVTDAIPGPCRLADAETYYRHLAVNGDFPPR